jgi:hypothetical protein
MPLQTRHVAAGFAVLFMGAVVVGGSGAFTQHHNATAGVISAAPADSAEETTPTPTPKTKEATGKFTASASRDASGKITISGVAASSSGDRLTVQRKMGGSWQDFPAGTTAGPKGDYSVWVQTSRSGNNVFRVKDEKTGATSDPVTVKV